MMESPRPTTRAREVDHMLQIAGMLCLALSAPLPGPGGELEMALQLLDELRVARASVHWQETSLAEALGELDERTEIPLRVDWRALDRLGVRARLHPL